MMKRLLTLVAVSSLLAAPAQADLIHRISSSVQLSVDAAASNATRIPSVYSVSGSNVDTTDGTTSGNIGRLAAFSAGSAPGFTGTTASVKVAGEDFSFSESYQLGDGTSSGSTVSSGVVSTLPVLGSTITSAGGAAGNLAGSLDSGHTMSITAGGAGTTATAQHVSELTIFD